MRKFGKTLEWALTVYGVLTLLLLAAIPFHFLPAEDAVILFQYSRNLAQHGAITYLANGPRVEGATDFAWMGLLAGAMRLGGSPFWAAATLNVIAVLALPGLLLKLAAVPVTLRRTLMLVGVCALAPQICAAASGFAVLPDAVLLTYFVISVLALRTRRAALAAFVLCLFRPDGVVFVMPLLAFLLLREKERWPAMRTILAYFLLPGCLYFVWRWRYFGELFPLPFLVKSDAQRNFGLVNVASLHQSLPYLGLTALILGPLLWMRRLRRPWLLAPLLGIPTLFYWTLRLDQNVAARFYYYLPLGVLIILADSWPGLRARRSTVIVLGFAGWLCFLALPLRREVRSFRDYQFNNVKSIAGELKRLPVHGTILTTEAGFLTFYSEWTTYDASGLNTPRFAHRLLHPEDVVSLAPDLIVLHPEPSDRCVQEASWDKRYETRTWSHLTRNLVLGAGPLEYELWLTPYGSEFYRRRKRWEPGHGDRECWLIKRGSPLHDGIVQTLRSHLGVAPD